MVPKAVPKMVPHFAITPISIGFLCLKKGEVVPVIGLEPTTPSLRMTCSTS